MSCQVDVFYFFHITCSPDMYFKIINILLNLMSHDKRINIIIKHLDYIPSGCTQKLNGVKHLSSSKFMVT